MPSRPARRRRRFWKMGENLLIGSTTGIMKIRAEAYWRRDSRLVKWGKAISNRKIDYSDCLQKGSAENFFQRSILTTLFESYLVSTRANIKIPSVELWKLFCSRWFCIIPGHGIARGIIIKVFAHFEQTSLKTAPVLSYCFWFLSSREESLSKMMSRGDFWHFTSNFRFLIITASRSPNRIV